MVLVLVVFGYEYELVSKFFKEDDHQVWLYGGLILLVLVAGCGICAVWMHLQNRLLTVWYALMALAVSLTGSVTVWFYASALIPSDIPRWMLSQNDLRLYLFTAFMPMGLHAIVILVLKTIKGSENIVHNVFLLMAVPLFAYVFLASSSSLFDRSILMMIGWIGFVVCLEVLFLFLLIRFICLLTLSERWQGYPAFFAKLMIAIFLPLIGLGLNTLIGMIFGDFSHWSFYVLALANGIGVCLPVDDRISHTWLRFLVRSAGLSYTFYFFIVFLPYLPLSLFAVILLGLGTLMLVPLALFGLHIQALADDIALLSHRYHRWKIMTAGLTAFCLLPAAVAVGFWRDRQVLDMAIQYTFSPDYARQDDIAVGDVRRMLKEIRWMKNDRNELPSRQYEMPYLSDLYRLIVFDNMLLSDEKSRLLDRVFADRREDPPKRRTVQENLSARLSNVQTESRYDTASQAWRTWVHLDLTDTIPANSPQAILFVREYATTIELEAGCWISDYYLYVEGKKEPGILAEKKAALWIYRQIRDITKRDPGILYYSDPQKVTLRVFPFQPLETRRTGIELIHRGPVTLRFGQQAIRLGANLPALDAVSRTPDERVHYVPAVVKANLPMLRRSPVYHVLLNTGIDADLEDTKNVLTHWSKTNPDQYRKLKFHLVNMQTREIDQQAVTAINKMPDTKGGFFLDRAIRQILYQYWKNPSPYYPVFVTMAHDMQHAILDNDWSDMRAVVPEQPPFHTVWVGNDDRLRIQAYHEWREDPSGREVSALPDASQSPMVRVYPNAAKPFAYLADNDKADIVLADTDEDQTAVLTVSPADKWVAGLALEGIWQRSIFHPYTLRDTWVEMVRSSFQTGIMTPVSSYIVVETEAQRIVLQRKQQQTLAGRPEMDLDENVERMSEPSLWWCLLLPFCWWWWQRRRSLKTH